MCIDKRKNEETMDNGYLLCGTELQSSSYILKLKNPSSLKFAQI